MNNTIFEADFNRIDIVEAHVVFEWDYNMGGIVRERPSNQRRNMSTGFQVSRMGAKMRPNLSHQTLSLNGKMIYQNLVQRYFPNSYTLFVG